MGRKNKVSPAEAVVADDVSPTPAVAPQIPAEEKRDESDSNNNKNGGGGGSHGAGHDLSRSRIFFMSFFVAGGQDSFFVISFFL